MLTDRVTFLGLDFDRLSFDDVLARLRAVTSESSFGYIVTPNVDHVVRLHEADIDPGLLQIYREAAICVCDSRVLQKIARLQNVEMTLVPGSDLTVSLLRDVVKPSDRIAVVGGDDILLSDLVNQFSEVEFVHHSPPMGLRHNRAAIEEAALWIAGARARFVLIAVGCPQAELVAAAVRRMPDARGMALCIGASLEFVTGRKARAPRWMQVSSLEWLHRLATEPRRMWRRYLVQGPRIFLLAARYGRGASTLRSTISQ